MIRVIRNKFQSLYPILSIISILMPDFLKFRHFQAGGGQNLQRVRGVQFSSSLGIVSYFLVAIGSHAGLLQGA